MIDIEKLAELLIRISDDYIKNEYRRNISEAENCDKCKRAELENSKLSERERENTGRRTKCSKHIRRDEDIEKLNILKKQIKNEIDGTEDD